MKILTVLTYYRPHTSGLTIFAERLAKALVQRGHQVTVLTMQYEQNLARSEEEDGVHIVRAPVLFRVSKGVIAPTFGFLATKLALKHDVLHLHLPQFDAAGVALRGRILGKPVIITYHCDLMLPPGFFNLCVNQVVHIMDHLAAIFSHRIVTYTEDYAQNSPYLRRYQGKFQAILPPVELPACTDKDVSAFRDRIRNDGAAPVIGMAARLAAEKGVEVLLEAFERIRHKFPKARIVFAGQHENVMGEQEYFEKLRPSIARLEGQGQWMFLGVLSPQEMACFFRNIDVLAVPSLNATESFGLVQIEAMLHGTPVIASNLPGVRQPVKLSGMGKVAEIGDRESWAAALSDVLSDRGRFAASACNLGEMFSSLTCAAHYEELYQTVADELRRKK